MTDMAMKNDQVSVLSASALRAKALKSFVLGDAIFRRLTFSAAIFVLLLLGAIIGSLIIGSYPALVKFGFGFLTSERWNTDQEIFGAFAPIYGTVISSFLAMLIAVPVGLGIAIFLTELCPQFLRRSIGVAIELLAGIPSIIYGIWGFFVLAPFLKEHVMPGLIWFFAPIPVLNTLFAGPGYAASLFTASLILAIMVLPFITAISRDVFATVPPVLKEAAFGIGCTKWEVVKKIVVPYTRVGVVGGVMLGLGRALGETMAVTFVIGNSHKVTSSLFNPATTISATIANEFQESSGMFTSALLALGLMLFVITFIVLAAARLMLMRLEQKAGA